MQNYRKRTRKLLLTDLIHNPQFAYWQIGTVQKDIRESDCIDPYKFYDDICYYLSYYNIPITNDTVFHMTQVFEKYNRFEVLRDAPKTPHKTKNEYIIQLNINYYYGDRKPSSSFFKEIQDRYHLTYRGTRDFFDFAKTLPSVKVIHGKKKKHSSIVSYCGFEKDQFFKDQSIPLWRRVSVCTVFMYIQEDRSKIFDIPNTFANHITIKNKDDNNNLLNKEIVDCLPEFYNSSIDLKKINGRMYANMSPLAYSFFVYERIFTKKHKHIYGGRLYSKFTQMTRTMRERVIDVCELTSVDMTASQMNLLYHTSFRHAPLDNHFDFYTFFLKLSGINEKYFNLLRNFSKLACSLTINAKRSSIPYMLQTYLAEEGLLYTHEEFDVLKKTISNVSQSYKEYNISGNVFKDLRVHQTKSSIHQARIQRLNNSKLKHLDKKLTQKELIALTYTIANKIIEYFNYANILNFKSNSTLVESNSMIKLLNSTNEFILSIHDEFIVSKYSDSEKLDNKFHSFIENESFRFSKNVITYEYVPIVTNNTKKNIIDLKIKFVKKLESYLPIKQYIIKQDFTRICFLT